MLLPRDFLYKILIYLQFSGILLILVLNKKTKDHEKSFQTLSLRVFNHRNSIDADRNYPGDFPFHIIQYQA